MHIFNKVKNIYEKRILNTFPEKLRKFNYQRNNFLSFKIGFRPFTLIDESGARINKIDGEEQTQTFIKDPELKYF